MFTGIVDEGGESTAAEWLINSPRQRARGRRLTSRRRGRGHVDSTAVSGVDLTVGVVAGSEFTVAVVELQRSRPAMVAVGDRVTSGPSLLRAGGSAGEI